MERKIYNENTYLIGAGPRDDEKVIYIHQTHKTGPEVIPDVWRFSLEAFASGYSILMNPFADVMDAVLDAAMILDGRTYVMRSDSLEDFRLGPREHKVMLLRGGYLSPKDGAGCSWKENVMKARKLSMEISSVLLLLDNDYQDLARDALDEGKDVAVLRCTMENPHIRRLVKEGAPALDSFSSWMEFPRAISFPMENGPFREPGTGRRFSMIIL